MRDLWGVTCRRNTIRLASCISFSSCSWWVSNCSSQGRPSSSGASCPRLGHSPQRTTSPAPANGQGLNTEQRRATLRQETTYTTVAIWVQRVSDGFMLRFERCDVLQTGVAFLVRQLWFLHPGPPRLAGWRFDTFFWGAVSGGELGLCILFFRGVCRAGGAKTGTDGRREDKEQD